MASMTTTAAPEVSRPQLGITVTDIIRMLQREAAERVFAAERATLPKARGCRCDHPIAVREHWHGPPWDRCLLCGHDVTGVTL